MKTYTHVIMWHILTWLTRPRSDVVFICTRPSALHSATLECVSLEFLHICMAEQDMRKSLPSVFLPVSNLFLNLE